MTEFPIFDAELEIRARGGRRSMRGRFLVFRPGPGRRMATVSDRGRVRKERVGPDAFGWQMREFVKLQKQMAEMIEGAVDQARIEILRQELERRNVHVLAGHDYNRPLGDLKSGTAKITSTREAVEFEVDLPDEADQPGYMVDVVRQIRAGLAGGGVARVPGPRPATAVKNAVEFESEPGNPGVQVRVINQAVLHELSIVTRPAYSETEIDVPGVRYRAGWREGGGFGCSDSHPLANDAGGECGCCGVPGRRNWCHGRRHPRTAWRGRRHLGRTLRAGRPDCDQERGDNPMRGLARPATGGGGPFRERW